MSASFVSPVGTESLVPEPQVIVDRLTYRHPRIYLGDTPVIRYAGRHLRFSPACPPRPAVRELRAVCGGRG